LKTRHVVAAVGVVGLLYVTAAFAHSLWLHPSDTASIIPSGAIQPAGPGSCGPTHPDGKSHCGDGPRTFVADPDIELLCTRGRVHAHRPLATAQDLEVVVGELDMLRRYIAVSGLDCQDEIFLEGVNHLQLGPTVFTNRFLAGVTNLTSSNLPARSGTVTVTYQSYADDGFQTQRHNLTAHLWYDAIRGWRYQSLDIQA
jgi:hypothetical protein